MVCVKCRLWLTMRALCRLPNILRWRVSDRVQGRWWSSPAHASGGLFWLWFVHITCARAAVALHDSYTSEQIMTSSATRFPMCSYLGDHLDNVLCARWSDITRRGEARGLWGVSPVIVRFFLERPPGIVGGSQEVDEVDKHSNSPAQFIAMLGDRFHASTGTRHWKIRIISQRAVIYFPLKYLSIVDPHLYIFTYNYFICIMCNV